MIDWLDLLAVQGTLKSLHQHHNVKALVLLCSAFFMVQLSHSYMTTGHLYIYNNHLSFTNHKFDYMDLCESSDVYAFNTLCRLAIAL